ncbi:MAG: pyruvate kinase [Desulfobacterales bacterium]|jgi:pyruvate kinase|nr:pyruvate kinase [Desulfobacterales bacterium]
MPFPPNKTKIVATIGPASDSPLMLEALIRKGMNVARLNFSHGDLTELTDTIGRIRSAAAAAGRPVAIMADLPGPKIRIGLFLEDPIELAKGDLFTLTTEEIVGDSQRVSVSFPELPHSVRPGDTLFLNDGYIQLEVLAVAGTDVRCRVQVGGTLRSRKGLNLPGIELGISAFTDHDRRCLEFAAAHGIDAVSQSFVDRPEDVTAVRAAAAAMQYQPFIIAKIERKGALDRIEDILDVADGIMVARGDLGVEIPIEEMAVVQKRLMRLANRRGKPVITATQMLESMITNRRPTRAESTDVANAIIDGADCVMLSAESAVGAYPEESVAMLAKIAAAIEPHRTLFAPVGGCDDGACDDGVNPEELIASSVNATIRRITPATVIVPTHSGNTARSISRFRLPVWIAAVSSQPKTCQDLMFSYGVHPFCESEHPDDWKSWARARLTQESISKRFAVLTEGPSRKHPNRNNRMEIIDLKA